MSGLQCLLGCTGDSYATTTQHSRRYDTVFVVIVVVLVLAAVVVNDCLWWCYHGIATARVYPIYLISIA